MHACLGAVVDRLNIGASGWEGIEIGHFRFQALLGFVNTANVEANTAGDRLCPFSSRSDELAEDTGAMTTFSSY